MNQKLTQKEPNLEQPSTIQEQATMLLKNRAGILINQQIVGKIIINENLPQAIEQFFTKANFYSFSFTQVTIQKSHGLESNPKQQVHLSGEIQQSESQVQQEDASGGPNNLQGLSAYNGKQTYINKILLDNAEKEIAFIGNFITIRKKQQ